MPFANLRWIALPCLAALLTACGAGEFDLEIIRAPSECDQKPFSTAPNGYLVVRVDGDGMDSIEFSGPADSIEFDPIEAGENRQVTVRLYNDDKRRELNAMGRSAPFTVSSGNTEPVRVVLYEAGFFRMAANQQGQCAQLRQARAGHSAVRLQDGRVLLAGGFQELNAEGEGVHTLRSAEIFDPVSGTFEAIADMPAKRALAKGVLLKDGRVLLVGGESESGGHRIALDEALIFDPKAEGNPWSLKQLHVARRGHSANLINQTGHVLVVGGIGEDGKVVQTVEFFDPMDEKFHKAGDIVSQGRAFHAAASVTVGNRPGALLAGGIDSAGKPTSKLSLIVWGGISSGYVENANIPLELSYPAVKVTGVWVDGASHFALFGGYEKWKMESGLPGEGQGEQLSGWIQSFSLSDLTKQMKADAIRPSESLGPIDACGVAHQKRAMAVGGLIQQKSRNPAIGTTGSLLDFKSSPPGPSLVSSLIARSMATCTDLGNGMVLLAGGAGSASANEPASGNAKAHRSAEIFVFR